MSFDPVPFVIVVAGFGAALWCWLRYQDTDNKVWLAAIAAVFLCSVAAKRVYYPEQTAEAGGYTECIHFRGNECF